MRALLLATLFVVGCGDDFNDDYNYVNGLRLLGAVAEPAEIGPGGKTTITAIAVDPANRRIAIDWSACTASPVAGSGTVNGNCLTDPKYQIAVGSGALLDLALPTFDVSALGPPDDTGGVYLPLLLHIAAGSDVVDGIERLRITNPGSPVKNPPNRNPKIASIDAQPGMDGFTLTAHFAAGSAEHYAVADCDETGMACRTEDLSVTWFATAGHVRDGSTGDGVSTTLTLSRNPPPRGALFDLWAVAHDGRGGSDVAHLQLQSH